MKRVLLLFVSFLLCVVSLQAQSDEEKLAQLSSTLEVLAQKSRLDHKLWGGLTVLGGAALFLIPDSGIEVPLITILGGAAYFFIPPAAENSLAQFVALPEENEADIQNKVLQGETLLQSLAQKSRRNRWLTIGGITAGGVVTCAVGYFSYGLMLIVLAPFSSDGGKESFNYLKDTLYSDFVNSIYVLGGAIAATDIILAVLPTRSEQAWRSYQKWKETYSGASLTEYPADRWHLAVSPTPGGAAVKVVYSF